MTDGGDVEADASLATVPTRWAELDDGVVVLDLATGRSHALLGGAAAVWTVVATNPGWSIVDVTAHLRERFGDAVPAEDVAEVARQLADLGLVSAG